jgi:hypothetical protein
MFIVGGIAMKKYMYVGYGGIGLVATVLLIVDTKRGTGKIL